MQLTAIMQVGATAGPGPVTGRAERPCQRPARAAALVCAAALSACASVEDYRRPEVNPLTAPDRAVAYAIEAACLPLVDQGASVVERVGHSGTEHSYNQRPGVLLYSRGSVYVQEQGSLGCYIRAEKVDASAMRQAALDTLTALGKRPRLLFDSGPASANLTSSGHRQELWCLDAVPGQGVVISTSNTRRVMQFSMLKSASDACGGQSSDGSPQAVSRTTGS